MGVLGYPRIHFRGKFLVNAATCNNNDVDRNIDPVKIRLTRKMAAMSDDQAYEWVTGGITARNVSNNLLFTYIRSGWNLYGDMSVGFHEVEITSVVGPDGQMGTDDPIVRTPVQILGSSPKSPPVMCDLDPTGTALAQLYLGGLKLGVPGSAGLCATLDTRCFVRWLTYRNAATYLGEQAYPGFAATWQCAFPSTSLTFDLAEDSPALATLQRVAKANLGVLVQFCIYLPVPKRTDLELMDLFRRKVVRANPVECYMVGTVGVWEPNELATAPSDRLLIATPDGQNPLDPDIRRGIGPATARVQPDRPVVSLNLVSTFPEANYDRPPTRKAYFGPARLGLIPAWGGPPVGVGEPFAYGASSYQESGGIVDVPYDPAVFSREDLESGTLVILGDCYPLRPILSENGVQIRIETDDRGTYLEVGEEAEIAILVRVKGCPPTRDLTIYLTEFQYKLIVPTDLDTRYSTKFVRVGRVPGLTRRLQFPTKVVFPAGRVERLPISVKALAPGSLAIRFTPDVPPPQADDTSWNPRATDSYAGVRVMPVDDYKDIPTATRLSWTFVYKEIFEYYHRIYPAMSQIIPFNDEQKMRAMAEELVYRTEPSLKMSTRYMPPTRDLSQGKRALLVEWANSVSPTGPAVAAPVGPGDPGSPSDSSEN